MYNCREIEAGSSFRLTNNINKWFKDHPNAEVINISIIHNAKIDWYHAFITWAEKEND